MVCRPPRPIPSMPTCWLSSAARDCAAPGLLYSAARGQRLCYFQRDRVRREPAAECDDPVEETGDHDAASALEAAVAEARHFGGTHHVARGAVKIREFVAPGNLGEIGCGGTRT